MFNIIGKYLSAATLAIFIAFWIMPQADRLEIVSWFDVSPTAEVYPVASQRIIETKLPKLLNASVLEQIECLADNIYYEAGVEDYLGKVAVARVVMERVASPKFPNSPCEVVYQGAQYTKDEAHKQRGKCQFSWLCQGKKPEDPNPRVWDEGRSVAISVYVNGDYVDVVPGALFYHANWMKKFPRWAARMTQVDRIGRHIFYTPYS